MTSSNIYSIVTLKIYSVTSSLQLLDVQNVRKSAGFSLTRVAGNTDSLFKMAASFYFLIFLCVRIEINSRWQ